MTGMEVVRILWLCSMGLRSIAFAFGSKGEAQ
jgi:hypothetical protein